MLGRDREREIHRDFKSERKETKPRIENKERDKEGIKGI